VTASSEPTPAGGADRVRVVDVAGLSAEELVGAKGGQRISVCLPARNEAATVGGIVAAIRAALMAPAGPALVDELIVLDDGSTDATAAIAAAAGARVVAVADILPEVGPGRGKGNVLWRSLAVATGDLVVWCDADVTSFSPQYVTRLVAPLLRCPDVDVVKGFYDRPVGVEGGIGGRTTELMARPLLARFFPALATVRQPLAGETAGRRRALARLPFVQGYGVEIGMLIDGARALGVERLAQVDLGVRRHRHQALEALSVQATEVMLVVLDRVGFPPPEGPVGVRPGGGDAVPVRLEQWPPLVEVLAG
jgi:glucosyl-3-phosphoglycerate synthase